MILQVVQRINASLSDNILLFLLLGIGIFFSIKTKFVQVRYFKDILKVFKGKKERDDKDKITSFKALSTAIAAQVGTGNLVGSCGAILIGGPGAIFWMWVIAFFGMATIYAETILAIKTREIDEDGALIGGPIFYIKRAFSGRFGTFLSILFSISLILALGFMGCMVQANSIGESINTAFGVPTWIVGLLVTALALFILVGGAKRITNVLSQLVPIMAILYLVGGSIILLLNIDLLPKTFALIFKTAFIPQATIGGSLGYALKVCISQGAKRGLFSNEAGMGSTPHAHALANVKNPHDQGVVAMFGVFVDTFIVLTMTALVVITSFYTGNSSLEGISKTNMTMVAFNLSFGDLFGRIFISISLFLFAFSTIISWNFFARQNMKYLFGKRSLPIFFIISALFIFLGSLLSNDLVWELTDMFNQLMVLPNALALIVLSREVKEVALKNNKSDK